MTEQRRARPSLTSIPDLLSGRHAPSRTGAGARTARPGTSGRWHRQFITRPRVQGEGEVGRCARIVLDSLATARATASCQEGKAAPVSSPSSSASHHQAYTCCRHIRGTEGAKKPHGVPWLGPPRGPGRAFPRQGCVPLTARM